MRVSKNKVTLLSLAVAGLFAAAAQAQVIVNNTPAGVPALVGSTATYANEINLTAPLFPTATDFGMQGSFGFGLNTGDVRYVRLDFTGANYAAAAGVFSVVAPCSLAGAPFVVSGGAVGSTSVIYQVTGGATGCSATGDFLIGGSAMNLTSKTPTVTYTLWQDSSSASNQLPLTSRLVVGAAVPLVNFANSVTFTMAASALETAAATTNFLKFCASGGFPGTPGCAASATDLNALIGSVTAFSVAPNKLQSGVPIANMTDIMTTGTTIVTTGTLAAFASAAAGSTMSAGLSVCGGAPTAGVTSTTTATSTIFGGTLVGPGLTSPIAVPVSLCYNVNGTTAIFPSTYSTTMTPTSVVGYTVAPVTVAISGQIQRDGLELQSPWFVFGQTGYNSRFFLTNTGGPDATCQVLLMNEVGNALTAGSTTSVVVPGTVSSGNANGGMLFVDSASVVTAGLIRNRAAVRFLCSAPSAAMQGTYSLTTSAGVSNTPMLRPGTN